MAVKYIEDNSKFKRQKEEKLNAIKELNLSEFSKFLLEQKLKTEQEKVATLQTQLQDVLSRLDALESV